MDSMRNVVKHQVDREMNLGKGERGVCVCARQTRRGEAYDDEVSLFDRTSLSMSSNAPRLLSDIWDVGDVVVAMVPVPVLVPGVVGGAVPFWDVPVSG